MTSHTDGPWEAGECGGWLVVAGPLSENRRGYLKGGRGQIAALDDDERDEEEQEANAHLIAAAPDMARALLAMGRIESPGVWHMDECWAAIRSNERQPCLGRCSDSRAALHKAKVLP